MKCLTQWILFLILLIFVYCIECGIPFFSKHFFLFWKFSHSQSSFKNLVIKGFWLGVVHGWRHSLRRRGQGFWDDSTKPLVQNSVTMGEGVKNYPDLCDVIFGPPLSRFLARGSEECVHKVTFISSSCLSLKRFPNVTYVVHFTNIFGANFCQSTSTMAQWHQNYNPNYAFIEFLSRMIRKNILCKLIGEMFEAPPGLFEEHIF